MNIEKLSIIDNNNDNDTKRLIANFQFKDNPKMKKIKFGLKNSKGTFYDGATNQKKEAYIKRHMKNENWNDITTAGALSRFVLWETNDKNDLIKLLKNKFKIKNVDINFKKIKIK